MELCRHSLGLLMYLCEIMMWQVDWAGNMKVIMEAVIHDAVSLSHHIIAYSLCICIIVVDLIIIL